MMGVGAKPSPPCYAECPLPGSADESAYGRVGSAAVLSDSAHLPVGQVLAARGVSLARLRRQFWAAVDSL